MTANTFRFGPAHNEHIIGDKQCKGCRWDTPHTCKDCGEGLTHIELSNKKIGPIFTYRCDLCVGKGPYWKKI